uniref:Tetraspanin n=1 Tax=Podospora anserina TaxID=2587412 RepID=B0FZ55_PODAS|nr:tetraspanin [Podospora anserina]
MVLLLALYVLLIITLTGLAIYQHHTSTTLSLPLSPTLTILTILLPLLSLLTTSLTFFSSSHPRKPLPPLLSNALQLLLTIILSTLFGATLTSPYLPCALQTTWRSLWTSHSATPIRTIQDSLSCCGFKSTKDMAWPFPSSGNNGDVSSCEKQFNRHTPCAGPWEDALNKTTGVELGVVVVAGVVQLLSLVWLGRVVEIFTGQDDEGQGRRPLLTGGRGHSEEGRYIDGGVEEEEQGGHENGNGYGGTSSSAQTQTQPDDNNSRGGPRVEVSHHDPWAGAERV